MYYKGEIIKNQTVVRINEKLTNFNTIYVTDVICLPGGMQKDDDLNDSSKKTD